MYFKITVLLWAVPVFFHAQVLDSLPVSDSTVVMDWIEVHDHGWQAQDKRNALDAFSIPSKELQKMRGNTLASTLSLIPGINALQTGTTVAKPVIRGFSGVRVAVVDHGLKQEGQAWGSDHGLNVDQWDVEKINVIKGPAALQYGSDAVGGVLEIPESKNPKYNSSGQVISGLTDNQFKRWLSVGVKNKISDHLWWRLRYSRQSSADYKVPASSFTYLGRTLPLDQGVLNNTAGQENQFTGYLKRQKEGRKFELLARWYSQQAGMFPGVIGVPTLLAVTSDGQNRNVSLPAAEVVHVTIQGAYKSTFKNGYWESNLGMQENTRKELSYAHKGQTEVDDTLAHQLSLTVYQLHVLRFWEWRGWAFKSGMQSSFFDHKRKGFEFLLPNYRQWNQGVFFQSEGPMGHAGWTLSAGLRFDAGGFDSQEGFAWTWLSGESNYTYIQRSKSVHQFFHAWSGAVGGFKTNSDKRLMKWNVARSFRMPQGAELTINGIHHGTFRHEMGNSELNPEQGIQADALWMETQGDWSWKLSPFYSYFSNYIYLSPQAQFSPMAEGGQVYAYLQHRVVLTGGEAWFEWKPAPWGHWDGAVEYVYTYNVDTQLPLPFIPPLQFKSSWEGEWEKDEWSGEFQIQWVKAMAQNAVDRNVKPTPGYQLVHGGGTLTHQSNGHSWSFNVRVINAFNAYYLSNMSMYRTLNLPEQGRMVQLTLTLNINSKK